jgi:hypothetical protein
MHTTLEYRGQALTPGELCTADKPPQPLVLLGRVVQHCVNPARPWKVAAVQVLDTLQQADDVLYWHLVDGRYARPVTRADVWRMAYPSGADRLQANLEKERVEQSSALVRCRIHVESIGAAEAQARGMAIGPNGLGPELDNDVLSALPALPALCGHAGLVEWLQGLWLDGSAGPESLTQGAVAKLAMLEDDAARLFGYPGRVDAPRIGQAAAMRNGVVMRATPDNKSWGPMLAKGSNGQAFKLMRIADAVHEVAAAGVMLDSEAVALLADRWAASDDLKGYRLRPGDNYADEVTSETVFVKGKPATKAGMQHVQRPANWVMNRGVTVESTRVAAHPGMPDVAGKTAALAKMRDIAAGDSSAAFLNNPRSWVAWLAFSAADVAAIVCEFSPAAPTIIAAPGAGEVTTDAADASIVQPEGGAWPHVEGIAWTDAERVAAFTMRHKYLKTGDQLATVVGVTRQRIDQEIGKVKRDKGGLWLKGLSWQPSPELLAVCGIKIAPNPLQLASVPQTQISR